MPKFETRGPDPDSAWFIVRIETITGVTSEIILDASYSSAEEAEAAADAFNANPDTAPKF